jgi:NADH-quinone oxidoreductase subunit G
MPVVSRRIVSPEALAAELAAVAADKDLAKSLVGKERSAIFLGHYAQQHPDFAALYAIAQEIGRMTGAIVGLLPDGANAVGAHLAGAVPQASGLDARAMTDTARRGYLVMGVEAEHDMGPRALAAIGESDFSVVLSAYRNATTEKAHVMLPIVPFTETAGTFVNMEGRAQSFNGVVKPQGDARPGWKVLRMLGSLLELQGFTADTIEDVRKQVAPDLAAWARAGLGNTAQPFKWNAREPSGAMERVAEFGIYAGDPIVRRSPALAKTADGKAARAARMNAATMARMGVAEGGQVRVRQGDGEAVLSVMLDKALPDNTVRIARGVAETAALGGEGHITLERVRETAVA